jgi:hypothetical protein
VRPILRAGARVVSFTAATAVAVALGIVLGAALVRQDENTPDASKLTELESLSPETPCVRLSDFAESDTVRELRGTTWGRLVQAKGLNVADGVFVATDSAQGLVSMYTVSGLTGCLLDGETITVRELLRRLGRDEG